MTTIDSLREDLVTSEGRNKALIEGLRAGQAEALATKRRIIGYLVAFGVTAVIGAVALGEAALNAISR